MTNKNSQIMELNKLKNIQANMEKTQEIINEKLCNSNAGLKAFILKLENERLTENKRSREKILKTEEQLNELRKSIVQEKSAEFDLNKLKQTLINIKQDIEAISQDEKKRLKELHEEENLLTEEVENFTQSCSSWFKPLNIDQMTEKYRTRSKSISGSTVYREVEDFDNFLKERGHTDGWSTNDHLVFLKLRKKYPQQIDKLVKAVNQVFPDISKEEIAKHNEFYNDYMNLKNSRKEALKKWRSEKKPSENSDAEASDEIISKKVISSIPKSTPAETQEQIKERLLAWKREKEQRKINEFKSRVSEEETKRQKMFLQQLKQIETKKMLENWKQIREAEQQAKESLVRDEEIQMKNFKALMANRLIKEFQTQDVRFIEKMQNVRFNRTNEKTPSLRRSVTQITVSRDPNRLLKPTKQWLARISKPKDPEVIASECNLNTIRKLGVPQWRKV